MGIAECNTAVFQNNTPTRNAEQYAVNRYAGGTHALRDPRMSAIQVSTTEVASEVSTLWQPLGAVDTGKVRRFEGSSMVVTPGQKATA